MLATDTATIEALVSDPAAELLGALIGGTGETHELQKGVWELAWWLSSPCADGWEDRVYGVADDVDQILAYHTGMLDDPKREFLVTVVPVLREYQSPEGGWRWHKWGTYIGTQNPEHEYLYDDKHIDKVLTYTIYEYVGR